MGAVRRPPSDELTNDINATETGFRTILITERLRASGSYERAAPIRIITNGCYVTRLGRLLLKSGFWSPAWFAVPGIADMT